MVFGTYKQDEEYLWKKFQSPEFDPATGIDSETAAKEIVRFADLDEPAPVIKARGFEFLAKNLQIEVDPHDFFPAFGCWKRVPRPIDPLLEELKARVPLHQG